MEFKAIAHDLDSSKDTWEKLYCKVYRNKFSSIFNFDNLKDKETSKDCKRWYIKIDKEKQPELMEKFPKFKMAGDCDFNFNDKKVDLFKKLLFDEDISLLMECHSNHHELWNFSFMPITGAMNDTKGCLKCFSTNEKDAEPYDRLDLFIYELNNFYEEKETRIFSRCTESNKDALEWYLRNFSDVYEYCRDVYFINDKEFVEKKMIESGKHPINSRDRVLEYMELAKRFWELKKNKLKEEGVI